MLMPETTQEVANAVKVCAQHDLKIVPQGGNTGLVGGQTPMGEVLLSTRRLTKIRNINAVNNAIIAEAGTTLQSIHDCADSIDRKFPLSLASQGSCTIGGNLSTNAGGNHVLKYGTSKDLVFGVEAVLANGEIYKAIELLSHCRSDNALSMFEVIPKIGFEAVIQNIPNQRDPFTQKYPWYVVVDWEVESEELGTLLAEKRLSKAFDLSLIQDAVIAKTDTQALQILSLREHLSAAQKFLGGSIKFDITIPLHSIPAFLKQANKTVGALIPGSRPVSFGHFGDGNIHYNISQPAGADKDGFLAKWQDVSEVVFDLVDDYNGSISAEHGIGTLKKEELAKRADPIKLALLKSIKNTLDPDNIMNPRVML